MLAKHCQLGHYPTNPTKFNVWRRRVRHGRSAAAKWRIKPALRWTELQSEFSNWPGLFLRDQLWPADDGIRGILICSLDLFPSGSFCYAKKACLSRKTNIFQKMYILTERIPKRRLRSHPVCFYCCGPSLYVAIGKIEVPGCLPRNICKIQQG